MRMMLKRICVCCWILSVILLNPPFILAEDWPTYRHDVRRGGITSERLSFPLKELWIYKSQQPPKPAWEGGPAKQDFWHNLTNLKLRVAYDHTSHVAVQNSLVFFASTANDRVTALRLSTGEPVWHFYTGGPIRNSPTVSEGRLYVGSDDGTVYCLDSVTGTLNWDYSPTGERKMMLGNGRLISTHPIRAGTVLLEDRLYFAAGLFEQDGAYLCALDAARGTEIWKTSHTQLSPQGYMLASDRYLYVPTGRTTPLVFSRATGEYVKTLPGAGGSFVLLPPDDEPIIGPGNTGELTVSDPDTSDRLASFPGLHMIVTPEIGYLLDERSLTAIDRVLYKDKIQQKKKLYAFQRNLQQKLQDPSSTDTEKAAFKQELKSVQEHLARLDLEMGRLTVWQIPCEYPYAMIMAGDVLILGGNNEIAAIQCRDGATVWRHRIVGKALGLAVAERCLLVSTDRGDIYCYESNRN